MSFEDKLKPTNSTSSFEAKLRPLREPSGTGSLSMSAAPAPEPEEKTPVRDFVSQYARGFASSGRKLQNVLPRSLGTVPDFSTGQPGRKSDEMPQPNSGAAKAGEFIGEASTFILPSSLAAKATTKAPFLLKSAAQGGASFLQESMNQGGFGPSSVAAGAVDAAFPVAGRVLDLGGAVLKGIAGGTTGAGTEVIEAALQRPGAAFKAAGDASTEALQNISRQVREGAQRLYKKAGEEYASLVQQAGLSELPRSELIERTTQRLAQLADGVVDEDGLKLIDSPFTTAEENQLTKVFNNIRNWQDFSAQGVNDLARKISRFRRGAADSGNYDRVIDTVRRELREFVGEVAPSIREANQQFAAKMDLLDEIDNVLRTNPNLGGREGVRRTAESLGRIFNSGKEFSREAIEDLERELGIDIIGTMAGQQLSQTAPRATARIGGVLDAFVQPVASLAARNLVPLAGATRNATNMIASIPGVRPATRSGVINTFANMFRQENNSLPNSENNNNR